MVVFAMPVLLLGFSKFKFGKVISFLVVVGAIVLNFNYFKTSEYLGRGDDYYINRYIPLPVASEEYKKTSEEYLRLPKDTEVRPSENVPYAYASVSAITDINICEPLGVSLSTDYPESFILNYSKYYFPGWFAKIDGKEVDIFSGIPYGQVAIEVPEGVHRIEIGFRETNINLIFDAISVAGLAVSVFLIFKKVKK